MKRNLLLSVLAGAVLFVWGFISWAMLPWHNWVANSFVDEAAVSQVLRANAPRPGVYYLPFAEEDHGPDQVGAFANVLPQGMDMNMGRMMFVDFLTDVVGGFLVLTLLARLGGHSYAVKVGFLALTGLIIGFVSHAPYWNWMGFSTTYVAVTILDTVVGWTLVGLAVAKFIPSRS